MEQVKKKGLIVKMGDYIVNMIESREPVVINKRKYCIITLLLGWLGVHQFIVGKKYSGFLYLLTSWCGLSLALTVSDLLIGLCKSKNENGDITI